MKREKTYSNGKKCPYCGAAVSLRTDASIYGNGDGWLWVCNNYPGCDAYVRCEPGTCRPLGILADKKLRRLRMQTHRMLDRIFLDGYMSRDDVYAWLRECVYDTVTGYHLPGHIAMMSDRQCLQTISAAKELYDYYQHLYPTRAGGDAA